MTDTQIITGVPVYGRADRAPVEAVGLSGGRVAAVGSLAEVRAALPADTVTRQLAPGGAVLPALADPHQHAWLLAVDPFTDALYRRAPDIRGLLALLATLIAGESDADRAASPWRRFHGYEPLHLAEHRSPTAAELDRVASDRPLHVISRTWHESVVNTAGLAALGIGRATADPVGGRIERDKRGNPTGVLLEAASFDAEAASRRDAAGPATAALVASRLRAHATRMLALGVTRIGDGAVPAADAAAFREGLAAGGLDAMPLLVGDRIHEPALLAGATAKVLLDGGEFCHLCMTGGQLASLMRGSFRAQMGPERVLAKAVGLRAGWPRREPDRRWHTGIRFRHEAGVTALLRAAADAGSSLAVHAVGNGAVAALLDAREADPGLAAAVPLRVEHAMVLDPALIRRLAAARVPVVVQPGFLPAVGHELAVAPLPSPLALMPLRSMADAGVSLVLSSDYPGAGLEPWVNLAAAVCRLDGAGAVIGESERLDARTAIDAASRQAHALLGAADAGVIEPGARADLVWLDRDPLRGAGDSLAGTTVLATWAGGRLLYERDATTA